jgi:hypothetical protein
MRESGIRRTDRDKTHIGDVSFAGLRASRTGFAADIKPLQRQLRLYYGSRTTSPSLFPQSRSRAIGKVPSFLLLPFFLFLIHTPPPRKLSLLFMFVQSIFISLLCLFGCKTTGTGSVGGPWHRVSMWVQEYQSSSARGLPGCRQGADRL